MFMTQKYPETIGHNNIAYCFKAEAEVKRLDQLKASKMKELFLKKKNELEDMCNKSHMEIPSQSEMDNIINLLNSGVIQKHVFVF